MLRFLDHYRRNRPRLLNNPILLRELVSLLRRKSSFVFLSIFLLLGVFILGEYWAAMMQNRYRYGYSANQVRECFLILNLFQGFVIAILVPLLSSTIVNIEHEQETWDLLITTPISMASILLGKLLSSILFVWILLVSLVPIYGLCLTLGGVSPQEILVVFALLTEVILVIGVLGLYCSIHCRRPILAISLTYIFTFLYLIGIPYTQMIISILFFNGSPLYGPEMVISPLIIAVIYFIRQTPPYSNSNALYLWIQNHPFSAHAVMVSLLIFLLLWLCFRTLQQTSAADHPKNPLRSTLQRLFPRRLPASQVFSSSALIPDGKNPVFDKDWRVLFGRRRFSPVHLFFPLVGIFILLTYLHEPFSNTTQEIAKLRVFFIFSLFASYFIIPFGVNAFRSEIDRGIWDLLFTTTLTSNQLFWGKFHAGLQCFWGRFWSVFALPFLGLLWFRYPLIYSTAGDLLTAGNLFIGMVVIFHYSLVLFLFLGIWLSLYSQKTVHAYLLAFGTALTVNLGVPILAVIQWIWYRSLGIPREFVESLMGIISPVTLLAFCETQRGQYSGWNWWKLVLAQMSWISLASFWLYQRIQWKLRRYYD